MTPPEPGHPSASTQADERGAALALLPIAATLDYYALPDWLQEHTLIQFAPQLIAYLAFALWASLNGSIIPRLGLETQRVARGVKIGIITGLVLGGLNALVILRLVPSLGYDIAFLKYTPHAQLPMLVMVPWFIAGIALFVELNFRGFLLGRLAALEAGIWTSPSAPTPLASCPPDQRPRVCFRPLHGPYVSAPALDRRRRRAHLGPSSGCERETFMQRSWPMRLKSSWCIVRCGRR